MYDGIFDVSDIVEKSCALDIVFHCNKLLCISNCIHVSRKALLPIACINIGRSEMKTFETPFLVLVQPFEDLSQATVVQIAYNCNNHNGIILSQAW